MSSDRRPAAATESTRAGRLALWAALWRQNAEPGDGGAARADAETTERLRLPKPPGIFRLFFARHAWIVDWLVVAAFAVPAVVSLAVRLAGATGEQNSVASGIVAVAGLVAVVVALRFRRVHPLVLIAVVAVCLVVVFPHWGGVYLLPALFGLYAVAVYSSVRAAWISFGTVALALAIGSLISTSGNVMAAVTLSLSSGFLALVATLVGVNVGNRKRYVEALLDRAAQLARERDQQAQLATVTERARIAREMHDIVAHSLTVMVALADGAELTAERDPARARDAMQQVAETGRAALADMRVVLGVLAEGGAGAAEGAGAGAGAGVGAAGVDAAGGMLGGSRPAQGGLAQGGPAQGASELGTGAPLAPQPGHDDLSSLIQSYRSAGMVVHFTVSGEPVGDTGVQVAVFRVLQEALTNSLRYAPNPKHVTVRVAYDQREIRVRVNDVGQSTSAASAAAAGGSGGVPAASVGSGRGIIGMRERVAAFGGTLTAGPTTAGGWQVVAVIPVARRAS
ncbi:sensor histidine kinase [Subtercola sp. YIM 133946]|uniref:sensor histidine kinase n=1 Tax=Subtercola sp. YIM 133946 TaxID=3118909 RepID=UPI002F952F0C